MTARTIAPVSQASGQPAVATTDGARAWFLAAAALGVAVTARYSRVLTVDAFYDLYTGRYVAGHGIPHENAVTVAAHGAPWIDQQWLAQVLYYGSWAAGGYRAVAGLAVAVTAAGFAVLAAVMLRRGAAPSRMFAWTAAALMVTAGGYQIQAQDFGYLLFAGTLALLLADSRLPRLGRRTWLLIAVLAVWANLHGSVLLGAGLTAWYAAYRAARALSAGDRRAAPAYLAFGAAALAAAACTPYGIAVVGYYRRFAADPELAAYIARWAPPSARDPATWIFVAVAAAVAVTVATAWRRGARPEPFLAVAVVALFALAMRAAGNECWFAIAGSLLAADAQARASAGPRFGVGFSRVLAGLMSVLAVAAAAAVAVTPAGAFERQVPRDAVARAAAIVREHPALHVLGDAYTGTAMLWLRPVMIGRDGFDARLEQYPAAELRGYFRFLFARGQRWQRETAGYGVVVLSRRSEPLARAMTGQPGWRVAYRGGEGIVLVRRLPPR